MSNYIAIQKEIDHGRGIAARVLGQPYNVYRVQATPAINFFDVTNRLSVNTKVLRRRISSRDAIEGAERLGTLFFEIVGDMSPWLTGDVFVQNDPVYGTGDTQVDFPTVQFNGFCLSFHGPIKKAIGARIERQVQVYRPVQAPDASGRWSPTFGQALAPMVLSNGQFSFGTVGQLASL